MAGVPLLLGFISKELMLDAFFEMPGPAWVSALVVAGGVLTSVFTFAYSGRIVLGALAGRSGRLVPEGAPAFLAVPAIAAAAGLAFGVVPFPLDSWISSAATATIGQEESVYLTLWHGLTPALAASVVVMLVGTALVLARHRVQAVMAPLALPISGLAVVDRLRAGTISLGVVVGGWAGSRSPRLHLAIPPVCLALFALIGVFVLRDLPPVVGEPSRPTDWVLVALVVVGTLGAVLARTRIAAIVVLGVVGFTMTLWYFALGAADVAITQLLVEILTVCVMVLLLRRLPLRFQREKKRPRIVAAVVAVGAGVATTLGVWAFTGRREMSEAAAYYLREGEELTGGANIVNTILVDFRALDTLGELTVLGVAGIAMAVLLHGRRPAPTRSAHLDTSTPLADAAVNSVFVRSITRLLGPVIIALSMILLLRGHQEPGGGFNAALIGGAGFALLYLAAPSDTSARVKWPYMVLIGAGVAIATATGFLGYADGSFLRPLHAELFGMKLTSALVFDVGVYLAVIGVVLAAFNLLGRQRRVVHDDEPTMIKEVSHR
ncbi:hypothetical protein BJF85_17445 [Saccharomonospora sp. CUA-673]|uniref:hydrogen gas-evolving membrane-bound hydrogenase subunit E n=1 Tax=Saccharomonospora sp. CUA-673 TaxID=1904969 RepID=UPI00095E0E76|nr:hydrogen gas-evolving membrane-bound hydrogenase subunit E [Saccharomonospora sp. CUA-673]OLT46220.1 hypothetical protein BJF85_17445 [Saccharomonospora sp. CUA-673]